MTQQKSIENMNFEDALAEIELIVKQIDNGSETLENSITSYERASKLKLNEAKLKIEKISKEGEGYVIEEAEF